MQVAKVNYDINWRAFTRGKSMFFPCLDQRAAEREVLSVTDRMQLKVFVKYVVEDGIRGLRVWRL